MGARSLGTGAEGPEESVCLRKDANKAQGHEKGKEMQTRWGFERACEEKNTGAWYGAWCVLEMHEKKKMMNMDEVQ